MILLLDGMFFCPLKNLFNVLGIEAMVAAGSTVR